MHGDQAGEKTPVCRMELILSSLVFLHPVVRPEMPFYSCCHTGHFSPSCRGTSGHHLLGADPSVPRPIGCLMFKHGLCAVPQACLLSVLQCMAVYCPKDRTPPVCLDRCGPGLNDSLDDSAVTLNQNAKDLSLGNSGWVKQWPAVTI